MANDPDTRAINVRVPIALAKRLDEYARREGRLRTWVYRQALEGWIEAQETDDDE